MSEKSYDTGRFEKSSARPGRAPGEGHRLMDLVGKTVLVTGGASGLGEATARYFVGQGSNVVIFDRDAERGKAIESELGGKVVFVAGSVLDDDDTQAAVAAATDLGGLRGVVACAGGARSQRPHHRPRRHAPRP